MIKFEKVNDIEERYTILANEDDIGWFSFQDSNSIWCIYLKPTFRGEGLHELIYPEIERQFNTILKPSGVIVSLTMLRYWKKKNAALHKTEFSIAEEKIRKVS